MATRYPDQIVLAVDVYQGKLMTEGWRKAGAMAPANFVRAYDNVPLAGVIVTDIDADIGDQDEQLGVISGVAEATRAGQQLKALGLEFDAAYTSGLLRAQRTLDLCWTNSGSRN